MNGTGTQKPIKRCPTPSPFKSTAATRALKQKQFLPLRKNSFAYETIFMSINIDEPNAHLYWVGLQVDRVDEENRALVQTIISPTEKCTMIFFWQAKQQSNHEWEPTYRHSDKPLIDKWMDRPYIITMKEIKEMPSSMTTIVSLVFGFIVVVFYIHCKFKAKIWNNQILTTLLSWFSIYKQRAKVQILSQGITTGYFIFYIYLPHNLSWPRMVMLLKENDQSWPGLVILLSDKTFCRPR